MKNRLLFFFMIISLSLNALDQKMVYKELVEQNVKCPGIVLRQSILETGWYKSNVCKNLNNLFGMTYHDGTKRRYRKYNNWKESISSYKNWQDQYYKGGNYYDFLECVYKNDEGECKSYATSKTYIYKLKHIKVDV